MLHLAPLQLRVRDLRPPQIQQLSEIKQVTCHAGVLLRAMPTACNLCGYLG